MEKKHSVFKTIFTLPTLIYTFVLILLPLLYILFLSFTKSDSYGGIIYELTFENYLNIFDPTYIRMLLKSSLLAIIATFICILISYPFALILRTKSDSIKNLSTKLIMVPFLTNSLIRTYGWIILLRKNGIINNILVGSHVVSGPLSLMYNKFGIVVGMVYTLLPFMLLPVCSSVFELDNNIIEAARDLGAKPMQIFRKIVLPQTASGVFNGSLMVFMPAIGYFFIADILGGGKTMIIGNLIKNQFLTARNWPFGSAISIFLIFVTLLLVKLYQRIGGNMDDLGGF